MAARKPPSDPSLNLAIAVVASSTAPLLLLDGDPKVIAASDLLLPVLFPHPTGHGGRNGSANWATGRWDARTPRDPLLTCHLSGGVTLVEAYEMDLAVPGVRAALDWCSTPETGLQESTPPSGCCWPWPDLSRGRFAPTRRQTQGRPAAREGGSAAGGPPPGRQQPRRIKSPASSCTERPQGAIRRNLALSARRPQPGDVDRRPAAATVKFLVWERWRCATTSPTLRPEHRRLDDPLTRRTSRSASISTTARSRPTCRSALA